MKIEVGSEIKRFFGKNPQIWKITRIELSEEGIFVFACTEKNYEKHKDNADKKKLYHHDELVFNTKPSNIIQKLNIQKALK